jgi:hypothetical protein
MGVDCIRERLCLKAQNSGFRGLPSDAGNPSKFASLGLDLATVLILKQPLLTEKSDQLEVALFV